jgi:hypothetical protein
MIKPISPNEVVSQKAKAVIPDYVFEAFNFLISKNFRNGSATVKQNEVVDRIVSREYDIHDNTPPSRQITREYLFDNHLLDVEDVYREAGWVVEYDKPAYCETYEATFKFTKKGKIK